MKHLFASMTTSPFWFHPLATRVPLHLPWRSCTSLGNPAQCTVHGGGGDNEGIGGARGLEEVESRVLEVEVESRVLVVEVGSRVQMAEMENRVLVEDVESRVLVVEEVSRVQEVEVSRVLVVYVPTCTTEKADT